MESMDPGGNLMKSIPSPKLTFCWLGNSHRFQWEIHGYPHGIKCWSGTIALLVYRMCTWNPKVMEVGWKDVFPFPREAFSGSIVGFLWGCTETTLRLGVEGSLYLVRMGSLPVDGSVVIRSPCIYKPGSSAI